MSLREYHRLRDGVSWRLVPGGLEVEGCGIERTRGEPATVLRVWEAYHECIDRASQAYQIPAHLLVATICTESGGRPEAVRLEPGYVSDEKTPGRVSVGLTQTLLSTAREALQMSFDRSWLLVPSNSVQAGAAYMASQARSTGFDPPLVAAAYNAGGLYRQPGADNRWKLRQYPIGTGAHVDRFVRFFNDAVFVLARHALKPRMGLERLLDGGPARASHLDGAGSAPSSISLQFASTARAEDVSAYSRSVLTDVLRASRLRRALITSTSRSPEEQARVMYDNLERYGAEAQKQLYGRAGDKVIDVYLEQKRSGQPPAEIKAAMSVKIRELGPTNVSRHAADPRVLNVFDVGPRSISDRVAFEAAARSESRITTFLTPPTDPGYHFEIPQPKA